MYSFIKNTLTISINSILKKQIVVTLLFLILLASVVYCTAPTVTHHGLQVFLDGIYIKDPNTASIDPNGLATFKNCTVKKDGIATTSTTGLSLENNTASTAGVPIQYSPALNFKSSAWDTDGSSDTYNWKIEDRPASGSTTYAYLSFDLSKNNGIYTNYLSLSPGSFSVTPPIYANGTALGATSTARLYLRNTSSATSGTPVQISPRLQFQAKVWNTTGAGSSETSDWIMENLPVSGTTPSSILKFGYSANGGAYSYPITFKNDGTITNNGLNTYKYSGSLADDATITLPDGSGILRVWSSTGERGQFMITAGGVVSYDIMSTSCTNADTDTYTICVYDGGSTAVIKNRSGGALTYGYTFEYF